MSGPSELLDLFMSNDTNQSSNISITRSHQLSARRQCFGTLVCAHNPMHSDLGLDRIWHSLVGAARQKNSHALTVTAPGGLNQHAHSVSANIGLYIGPPFKSRCTQSVRPRSAAPISAVYPSLPASTAALPSKSTRTHPAWPFLAATQSAVLLPKFVASISAPLLTSQCT
jgi:hypothetical protein